jgi:hypothetical protein
MNCCSRIPVPDRMLNRVLKYIQKSRGKNVKNNWMAVYRDLDTFRTSMPSVWVADFAEFNRRDRDWNKANIVST